MNFELKTLDLASAALQPGDLLIVCGQTSIVEQFAAQA